MSSRDLGKSAVTQNPVNTASWCQWEKLAASEILLLLLLLIIIIIITRHKILWDLRIQTDTLISARRPQIIIINKKQNPLNSRLRRSSEQQSRFKENVKYLNHARELKEWWKRKETTIPIVTGVLGTIHKAETIPPKNALLRATRILRIILETWGIFLLPRHQ